LKINQPFPTKAEAENFALEVAKRWIDDTKPETRKHIELQFATSQPG
jgi:hypothetical protein